MARDRECSEKERLRAQANSAIQTVIDILLEQQRLLNESGVSACVFDAEFGKAVGEKIRAIGALSEHEKEHGCA